MNVSLYRTTPTQEIFDDIKGASIRIWQTYDDTYGYATEKIDRINSIENYSDNYMAIVGMFDNNNQSILCRIVKPETLELFQALHKEGLGSVGNMSDEWLDLEIPADDSRRELLV
jgi:hypothetical protein